MRGERLRKAESIFQMLADLPAEQRQPLMAEQCRGDDELRAFVERLLASHDAGAGDWLRTPVFADVAVASAEPPASPRRIGRYEIVRVIGEGGMGTVYEARQENPRRRVALKVIRPGMTSGHMLRRFQHEADMLGQLQHPGIAQIYEAGMAEVVTATGPTIRQPFFALELIRGKPLNAYARSRQLGTGARLELLARVCDAVQHAHQKGVIHRDLKPGNILVDQSGQPKVLDFGVARATDADMQTITMQTDVGQLIGTVPYMSPEQVTGDSRQLDTRSDVYALGVILYELLSGSVPHDVGNLSIPEAARKIRDEEPAPLASINKRFRGETDTIVAKALQKDKTRRYQSASELAADIRRYLAGAPIEAKRDSAIYVLRKTVARYRGLVATGGLLIVLLAAFGIVSFIQAERNRRLAEGLATALTVSNIERGRLFTRGGHLMAAEDLIWREHLRNPRSNHSYWALWELYSQNPSLATFVGHEQHVRPVAFAPDGRTFATGGYDSVVKTWDAASFRPVASLEGHADKVWSVAYSPDSRRIASASLDGAVIVWEAATGERLHTLQGHDGSVYGVDFAAGGKHLVSAGEDATAHVWDVETGRCVNVLDEHRAGLWLVCFSPGGELLATGASDGTIKLWRNLTSPSIATLSGHERDVSALAFSPDGRTLASGSTDKVIKLWDLATLECTDTIPAANGTLSFLSFGRDGRTLTAGGWHRIDEWNLATRRRRPLIMHGAAGGCISPDRRVIIAGTSAGTVRVTDILADAGEIRLGGKSNAGVASISPDGRLIACGDAAGHVRLWETATGKLLAKLESSTGRWSSAQFHPSGDMLATCGADGGVRFWDLTTGTCVNTIDSVHVTTAQSLSFSPDGRTMATVQPDGTVTIRDVPTGAALATLPSLGSEALSVRFSPDGTIIATTHRRAWIGLWSPAGERLGMLETGVTPWTVDFRPDGRKLAAGCWASQIQIWDLETRTLETRIEEPRAVAWGVAYMPTDTNILASCAGDGTVQLWDLNERRNLLTLDPFDGADALSVTFSPDGKTLVAAGFDGSLCVWDLEYYDRHIAGNLEYQIGRLGAELGDSIQTGRLRAWAEDVLRRPWPRIGPHARERVGLPETTAAPRGIDPEVIAAWGRPDRAADYRTLLPRPPELAERPAP